MTSKKKWKTRLLSFTAGTIFLWLAVVVKRSNLNKYVAATLVCALLLTGGFFYYNPVPETLAAVVFSDDFNRADSENCTIGGGWTCVNSGANIARIEQNTLASFSNQFNSGGYRVYQSDQTHKNDLTIKHKIQNAAESANSVDIQYVLVRANGAGITNGYGVAHDLVNSEIEVVDNGVSLATAPWTYSRNTGTTYEVEIAIDSTNSIDVRIWNTTGSRPSTPTLSYATSSTPVAAGDNVQISGNFGTTGSSGYAHTIRIDDYSLDDALPSAGGDTGFNTIIIID